MQPQTVGEKVDRKTGRPVDYQLVCMRYYVRRNYLPRICRPFFDSASPVIQSISPNFGDVFNYNIVRGQHGNRAMNPVPCCSKQTFDTFEGFNYGKAECMGS
jgi:hypothetical protein